MINPVNVEVITDKLLAFLESTTDEYVPLSFSRPFCPEKKTKRLSSRSGPEDTLDLQLLPSLC